MVQGIQAKPTHTQGTPHAVLPKHECITERPTARTDHHHLWYDMLLPYQLVAGNSMKRKKRLRRWAIIAGASAWKQWQPGNSMHEQVV